MIGPTGVGKTEIARRLANLAQSPFIKVEASKFTEVGYVGRDVESMVRDLLQLAINMVTKEEEEGVTAKAASAAEERLLDLLLPPTPKHESTTSGTTGETEPRDIIALSYNDAFGQDTASLAHDETTAKQQADSVERTREKLRRMLHSGELDDRTVELSVTSQKPQGPVVEVFSASGMEDMQSSLQDAFSKIFPGQKQERRFKVPAALEYLKKKRPSA